MTDLHFNGVLGTAAKKVGIRGVNGSISKQMKEQLVIGKVKHSTTTDNTGCDGNGGTFGAGSRELRKGEEVAVRPPAKIGNSACKHPNPKCKPVTITANSVFPVSCWNFNGGTVVVVIWVHKQHKFHPRHHRRRHTVFIKKVTKDSNGAVIPTPTGTFRFRVNVPGRHSRVVKLNTNPQYVGNYVSGTHGHITEIKPVGKQDWETVSAVTQPMNVHRHKLVIVFVNKEKSVSVPSVPPKEGICNGDNVNNGVGTAGNCSPICGSTTIITGNNNTVNNEGSCKPETPPPPPEEPPVVKHWTEISCTGFEEISGGGSFLVDCAVSNDSGAPISLEAHSNDGNSRVSGINCYSNGGSQTCPSGGTFEFRVSGINNGSSILYSSITATASANGVKATFTSESRSRSTPQVVASRKE